MRFLEGDDSGNEDTPAGQVDTTTPEDKQDQAAGGEAG